MKNWILGIGLFLLYGVQALAAVNINTASEQELRTIKGIGPEKARAIVEYRDAYGPFKQVEDLRNVKGFGEKSVARLKPLLTTGQKPLASKNAAGKPGSAANKPAKKTEAGLHSKSVPLHHDPARKSAP
ncbi:MAG: hypothetical protein Fur0040_09500 [Sideroxydans sp.]